MCDSIAHWGRACKCHIDEELCIIPPGPAHQFTYENIGMNVEISELNACFGRWQLREWKNIENKRRSNYKYLYDLLKNKDFIKVWNFHNEEMDSPFVFPVLSYDKDIYEIWEIMRQHGIEIRTLMGGVTPSHKAFKHLSKDLTDFPNAEEMANHAFFCRMP